MTEILDLPLTTREHIGMTIRSYLKEVLVLVWKTEDVKQIPLLNDWAWKYPVFYALVTHEVMLGDIDSYGWISDFDVQYATSLISDAIRNL